MHADAWVLLNAPHTATAASRRGQELVDICAQFDVVHEPRYAKRNGATYCNIFVWDCTRALGAEVPHWVYDDGRPAAMAAAGAHELDANAAIDWLAQHGSTYGWNPVVEADAYARADLGFPVVCTWRSPPGGIGHVSMVLPGHLSAQAGGTNFFMQPVSHGFGNLPVAFYSHN